MTASSLAPRVCTSVMKPQDARLGIRVKVADHHRIEQRRGLVGKVVGCYGGEEHVVVNVRFPDGRQRLFQPEDLEKVASRSEEHTSELQSRQYLVCRLLLEKKN